MTTGLAAGIAFGPIVLLTLWLVLLNHRDRRRDALEAAIGACCAELGLRGMVAVHVRVGACRGGVQVMLDMRLCTSGQVCEVFERLPARLPRRACLWIVVTGLRAGQPLTPFRRAAVTVL